MSASDWREQLRAKVRNLQIIVGAMSFGCFSFLIIAILASQNFNAAADQLILTYIALGIAAIIFGIWVILPGIIVVQGRKNLRRTLLYTAKQVSERSADDKREIENSKAQAIINLLQSKILVGSAILEGAVFFLLIAFMVEHYMPCLSAAILLLILLSAQMPTSGRATNWVENQLKLVD